MAQGIAAIRRRVRPSKNMVLLRDLRRHRLCLRRSALRHDGYTVEQRPRRSESNGAGAVRGGHVEAHPWQGIETRPRRSGDGYGSAYALQPSAGQPALE